MKKLSIIRRIRKDFNLNGISEMYFWKSEWEDFDTSDKLTTVSIPYVIYRFLYMAFFIAATTANMICSTPLDLYFIFLTNLSFLLQFLYSILFFALVLMARISRNNVESRLFGSNNNFPHQQPHLPWLNKLVWILINIVSVVPYGVTFGYWTFLYADANNGTQCEKVNNVIFHASNSVVALIDFMIIAVPIQRSHMVFPILAAFSYILFSVLYEVSGGAYRPGDNFIYSILNWNSSAGYATLSSVLGVVFAGVGHFVLCWGLSRFRLYIANKWRK